MTESDVATAEKLGDLLKADLEKTAKNYIALEAYEFMLTHLEKLVLKAKEAHQSWNRWAPPAEQRDFNGRLRELEETLSACDSRATMEREMALDEPSTSTSTSTFSRPSRGTDKIGTDTVRALYKRNLELDNDIKVLKKKKLNIEMKKQLLEIQLLERQLHGDATANQ
ncbi:unnamed protein product [Arctogadus glacialis]